MRGDGSSNKMRGDGSFNLPKIRTYSLWNAFKIISFSVVLMVMANRRQADIQIKQSDPQTCNNFVMAAQQYTNFKLSYDKWVEVGMCAKLFFDNGAPMSSTIYVPQSGHDVFNLLKGKQLLWNAGAPIYKQSVVAYYRLLGGAAVGAAFVAGYILFHISVGRRAQEADVNDYNSAVLVNLLLTMISSAYTMWLSLLLYQLKLDDNIYCTYMFQAYYMASFICVVVVVICSLLWFQSAVVGGSSAEAFSILTGIVYMMFVGLSGYMAVLSVLHTPYLFPIIMTSLSLVSLIDWPLLNGCRKFGPLPVSGRGSAAGGGGGRLPGLANQRISYADEMAVDSEYEPLRK